MGHEIEIMKYIQFNNTKQEFFFFFFDKTKQEY